MTDQVRSQDSRADKSVEGLELLASAFDGPGSPNGGVRHYPSPPKLEPIERLKQRAMTFDRLMRTENHISDHGLLRCHYCGRNIRVGDMVSRGVCPFCLAKPSEVLPIRKPGRPRLPLNQLPFVSRQLTEALLAHSEPTHLSIGPVNDQFDGDLRKIVRWQQPGDVAAPHPTSAVWELTLACDLGCLHCGSRAGMARKRELKTSEALDVVRQLAELGVRELTLIGGEAYLYEGWLDVVREATRRGIVVGMQTGGMSLTVDRIAAAVDAGLVAIGVSIDGLESTHDFQRGRRGSWRAAIEASERVAESPLRLSTNSQINRLSLPELPALAKLLTQLQSKAWQLQLTVAMGRAADRPELLLQPFDLATLFPLLAWLKDTLLDPQGLQLIPGNNLGYFGPYEEILRYGGAWGGHWIGCQAGSCAIGLEADGKIKGCPSLATQDFTGGNVRDQPIEDVLRNSPELTVLQDRSCGDLWGRCRSCYYASVCRGGCTWTAHSLTGRSGNNPFCIHRVLELERMGVCERLVRRAPAPGQPFDRGEFEIVDSPLDHPDSQVTVLGVPLDEVLAMSPYDGGVWDRQDLIERLRAPNSRAERLPPSPSG